MIELESKNNLSQDDFDASKDMITSFSNAPEDFKWLVDSTEKYCQDKALYIATSKAIEIQTNASLPLDEQNNKLPGVGVIPDILRDALSVCFDTTVGHDYFEDYEERWANYTKKVAKLPFNMDILNRITKGGIERKTLNLIMAGVNVGKSLTMCSLAADYLSIGYNVLYISMEMSEEMVSKRIDANLMNISLDDFDTLTGGSYKDKICELKNRNKIGKLIIKQFPTGGASVHHFNALMEELQTKKGWKPDVVIVDYLGICASCRMRNYSENSYALVGAIAEELRGFAFRWNVAVWSGAQTTRSGWNSTDVEMGDIAESAKLAATADFVLALMETDELAEMGQYLAKQIKSRYGDKSKWSKFNIGVDKGKQRIYELEETMNSKTHITVEDAHRDMQRQANHNAMQREDKSKSQSKSMTEVTKRQKMIDFDVSDCLF